MAQQSQRTKEFLEFAKATDLPPMTNTQAKFNDMAQDEKVKINKSQSCGMDEMWCEWYTCPECKSSNVIAKSNFCSNCGCEFEWVEEEKINTIKQNPQHYAGQPV